jgi:hypothetical protein
VSAHAELLNDLIHERRKVGALPMILTGKPMLGGRAITPCEGERRHLRQKPAVVEA